MSSNFKTPKAARKGEGFTLTEILAAVSIAGILGAISLPMYTGQVARTCQRHPEALMSQIMTQAMAFNDEFGTPADGWDDLDKIATIMTTTGPASGSDFSAINLTSCDYSLKGSRSGNQYIFNAWVKGAGETPLESGSAENFQAYDKSALNLVGCINVATGSSDINVGDGATPASTQQLTCN